MDLSQLKQLINHTPVTPIKQSSLLRLIHTLFPLGHRLYFAIEKYTKQKGLISVPWGKFKLLLPARWLDPFSLSDLIFKEKKAIPELAVIQPIIERLEQGTIVDVGAAIGLYTLHFRQYSKVPIVAYEPSPLAFAVCQKNLEINQIKDVEIRNKACGDRKGFIFMEMGINSYVSKEDINSELKHPEPISDLDDLATLTKESWTKEKVILVKLEDDLQSSERISFIKIDCEGFEHHILLGAKQIIEKDAPILFIEIHPQFIQSYGYKIKDICDFLMPYYKLEYWDFQHVRKMNRYARLFSHYFSPKGYKFTSEAEMLAAAETKPVPTQLYLLGYPRHSSV